MGSQRTKPHAGSRTTINRWISVLSCGALAGIIAFVLAPLTARTWNGLVEGMNPLTTSVAVASAIILLAAIHVAHQGWNRLDGTLGASYFWRFPPLVVPAVATGVAVWIGLGAIDSSEGLDRSAMCPTLGILASLSVALVAQAAWMPVRAASRWLAGRRTTRAGESDDSGDPKEMHQSIGDLAALLDWIRTDSPVSHEKDDYFDHDDVARRIAARLSSSVADAPTIALIGVRGSGKTTIKNLVLRRMRNEKKVCHVQITLWPFDSPEAAVRGILDSLINELGRFVNVLSLRGIPDQYVSIIESASGRWAHLIRSAQQSSSPQSVVDRVSDVLETLNLRFVLWIEDLERFAGTDVLDDLSVQQRMEVERLGPIRALLHSLDQSKSISVIVADSSLESRFDINKIARFVERPPKPGAEQTWRCVSALRQHCLNGFPRKIIDAATREERDRLSPPTNDIVRLIWLMDNDEVTVASSLALVLDAPRQLKSALRVSLETWEALCGEVDFDDVLIASTIRTARPKIFALIVEHADYFRGNSRVDQIFHGVAADKTPEVRRRFDELVGEERDDRHREAVRCLVQFVFPGFGSQVWSAADAYWQRPQGFASPSGEDYWTRYLTLPEIETEKSDQQVLADIGKWKQRDSNTVVQRLTRSDPIQRFERFSGQFEMPELCRLFEEVTSELAKLAPSANRASSSPDALSRIWRMMHARRGADSAEQVIARSSRRSLSRACPVNLALAHEIVSLMSRARQNPPPLLSEASALKLERHLYRILTRFFVQESKASLATALVGAPPSTLFDLCWPALNLRQGNPDVLSGALPQSFWSVVLDSTSEDPLAMMPYLLCVVTSETPDLDDSAPFSVQNAKWRPMFFRQTLVARFFDVTRLKALFAQINPQSWDDQDVRHRAEVARAWAQQRAE